MKSKTIRSLAFGAVVAAVYAALTMLLAPISYGPVQFRISEALCVLPFFFPASTWGLFAGCILANLLSAYGPIDVIFGSLATLLAAVFTALCGRYGRGLPAKLLACFPPVLFNAVIVGAVLAYAEAPGASFLPAWGVIGLQVGAGELAVLYLIGLPLLLLLPKTPLFRAAPVRDLARDR